MKRIVSILFLVVISVFLVACENMTLTAPTATLSGDQISWDEIADAEQYYVYIDNNEASSTDATYFAVTTTSYDLTQANLDDGTYTIYVVAINGTNFSSNSNAITYTVGDEVLTLSAPTNVTLTDDMLSWDMVADATMYTIYIDEQEIDVTTTSYDLSQLSLMIGNYDVYVVASNDDLVSAHSQTVTYMVDSNVNVDMIVEATLPMMDDDYTVDLTMDDFEDDESFMQYQNAFLVVSAYANASVEAGLTDEDAIGFFNSLMVLMNADDEVESLSDFMAMMNMFDDHQVTPEVASHLMMQVLMEGIAIEQAQLDMDLVDLQAVLETFEMDIATLMMNTDYVALLSTIASHVPLTAYDTALAIATGDYQSVLLVQTALTIASDRHQGFYVDNAYYYRDDIEDAQVDDLVEIIIAIENSDDADILDTIDDLQLIMIDLMDAFENFENLQDALTMMTMAVNRVDDMMIFMENEADSMEDMIETVFAFMLTMHEAFPDDVLLLLEQAIAGETPLTLEEIVYVKNELVALVQSALPDETEYQAFYEALLMMNEVLFNHELATIETDANYLGSLNYHMINVGLLLIESVTVDDIEDVMILLDDIQMMNVENMESMDELEPIFNLFFYMDTYFETFKEENETAVNDLEALMQSDAFEPIYQDMLGQVLALVEELEPEDADMIAYLIERLMDEYDHLVTALGIAPNIAEGLIGTFIESEGSILSVLYDMDVTDPSLEDIALILEDLIDELAVYHDVIDDEFTEENVESVISLLMIPVLIESGAYMDETAELAWLSLVPDLTTIVYQVLTLETSLFQVIDQIDMSIYFNETLDFVEPIELGSALMMLHALDAWLTEDNEMMIGNTVSLVFDVLNTSVVEDNLGIDLDFFIDEEDLENLIDDLTETIHGLAMYDITTLTLEQEMEIMQFMSGFDLYIRADVEDDMMMENALMLTLDETEMSFYRTQPIVYAFTPTEEGIYEFEFQAVTTYGYLRLATPTDDAYLMQYTDNGVINMVVHLQADETYYLFLELDEDIYVDVDMTVSEMDMPS